jgi:hypothetical protein
MEIQDSMFESNTAMELVLAQTLYGTVSSFKSILEVS